MDKRQFLKTTSLAAAGNTLGVSETSHAASGDVLAQQQHPTRFGSIADAKAVEVHAAAHRESGIAPAVPHRLKCP